MQEEASDDQQGGDQPARLRVTGVRKRLSNEHYGQEVILDGRDICLSPALFELLVLIIHAASQNPDGDFNYKRFREELYCTEDAIYRRLRSLAATLQRGCNGADPILERLYHGYWRLTISAHDIRLDAHRLRNHQSETVRRCIVVIDLVRLQATARCTKADAEKNSDDSPAAIQLSPREERYRVK